MRSLKIFNNDRGQSSIETIVMALVMVLIVIVFVASLYLMYASYWAEHIMYETLICYQERGAKQVCLREAEGRIDSILWFEKNYHIKLESKGSTTKAHLKLEIHPPIFGRKTFHFMKELKV